MNMQQCLLPKDRLNEAMSSLDEARELFELGGFDHHAFAVRLQQAELLLELQAFDQAYREVHGVKDYFDTKGLLVRSVRASLVMVSALVEKAQRVDLHQEREQQAALLHEALAMCKRIALQAKRYHLQEEVYRSHHLLGKIFGLQGDVPKASRHYEAAIVQIERMLNDLAYDLSPWFLRTTWAVYEDIIALCLEQSHYQRAFAYLERARLLALRQYLNKSRALRDKQELTSVDFAALANRVLLSRTQQELERWQKKYHDYDVLLRNVDTLASNDVVDREVIQYELKRCEEKINELFEQLHLYQVESSTKISVKRRARSSIKKRLALTAYAQHLAPGQLMLAYCLCKGKLVIFTVTAEGLTAREIPDGLAQIDYWLPIFHARMLSDVQFNQQQVVRQILHKLYNLLIAPVFALLPPQSGSLIIIPYGSLHQLPFHAIYDGSQFLIEKFQISYLPASSTLIWFNEKGAQYGVADKEVVRKPLILGCSGNGELQRALEEATSVAQMIDGNCYWKMRQLLQDLLNRRRGVLLSTLRRMVRSGGMLLISLLSCLLMELLNAIDTFSLDLHACELVTLSGCETGLAQVSGGDEQVGLGRAFLAAGAHSLLMKFLACRG